MLNIINNKALVVFKHPTGNAIVDVNRNGHCLYTSRPQGNSKVQDRISLTGQKQGRRLTFDKTHCRFKNINQQCVKV